MGRHAIVVKKSLFIRREEVYMNRRYSIPLDIVLANMMCHKTGSPMQYMGRHVVERVVKMVARRELPLKIKEVDGRYYIEVDVPDKVLFEV